MDIKFCDQCGASMRAVAKFCPNCGAEISSINKEQEKKISLGIKVREKDSSNGKKKSLPKIKDKKLSKKNFIFILSITSMVVVAGIVLLSVFLSRSCSSSNITSSSTSTAFSEETSFNAMAPGLAELVSADQLAILSVDGPPQAYTIYIDPLSGSIIEQWSYYVLGREINFLDGVYQGGTEVPLMDAAPSVSIPQLPLYSWEILRDFSPEAVISKTGTAIFNTSAIALPGWNDGYEVARLWLLSGGGNMITVDDRLVMLDIDPGEALDLDQFTINDFLVGTLVDDNNRLGAILSPDGEDGSYRLSLSPRGQGTTEDGKCLIFKLEGPTVENTFIIGEDAEASIAGIDGSENIAEANGTVIIEKNGNDYELLINARINDQDYMLSGFMGSAIWRSNDSSTTNAIGNAPELTGDATELILVSEDESEGKTEETSESEWFLVWSDTFDSNENEWPVSYGEQDEWVYYQSDIFEEKYWVLGQQKKEGNPFIERLIPKKLTQEVFSINIDVVQEGDDSSGGGLVLSDKSRVNQIYFIVFAEGGYFGIVQRDSGGLKYPLDYSVSAINPSGQINTLLIKKFGSNFYFFINSELVGGVTTIDDFAVEYLGVVVKTGSEEPITCYFDNLEVYEIQ